MSKLDDAIMARIREIVIVGHRPFCYKDFETFEINQNTYCVAHGTFRNKVSMLVKEGKIELEFNSKICFYTLVGVHFGNTMTRNHMGVSSVIPVTNVIGNEMEDILNYMKTIPVEQASVHDIHYKFTVTDIYRIMSINKKYSKLINERSKDIILPPDIIDGMKLQTIIHKTNTVTVSVACSHTPITIDEEGYFRSTQALTRVEERLSAKLDECGEVLEGGYEKIPIPDNRRWLITMWHLGKDGRFEYKNGRCLTWGYGREVFRSYTKNINGKKIRNERQEYPNITQEQAFKGK